VNKQKVAFGVSIFALAGAAVAAGWGCSSSGTTSPYSATSSSSSSGAMSTSSSSGSGSSSGGGSSSSGAGSSSSGGAGTTLLIDDGTGTGNQIAGYWYTFSDRTVPNSEPSVLAVLADGGNPPGTINPLEGTAYTGSTVQATLGDGTQAFYREFQAAGESTWGCGFGMDFSSHQPTGSDVVPFNNCPGSPPPYELPDGSTTIFNDTLLDAGTVGIVLPYDASQWTGVQFWIATLGASPATLTSVVVNIDDDQTSPWGGTCGACVASASTTAPFECSNSWALKIAATPTWTQFKVPFASMKPDSNWNNQGLVKGGIHANKLYNLHWKFETNGTPLPAVDVGVATVEFYL